MKIVQRLSIDPLILLSLFFIILGIVIEELNSEMFCAKACILEANEVL